MLDKYSANLEKNKLRILELNLVFLNGLRHLSSEKRKINKTDIPDHLKSSYRSSGTARIK